MNNYDLIRLLYLEMSKPRCDAKAEPLVALALEKGISYEDFMVCCDGLFYREYSKDVFYTELQEDIQKKQLLQLHLSRDGIYDQLPEGLFFQPSQAALISNAAEMAAEHRINKQKEKEIRRFFQPFEHEFFWQGVQLEIEESGMLEGLKSGIISDYFIKFWGLPDSIAKQFVVPLILLLPYASKIAGDLSLTSKCLEILLHETVQVKKVPAPVTDASFFFEQVLGSQQSGVNMVCGQEFAEDYPVLKFSIGPLQSHKITNYLEGGDCFALINTFYRFFLPAGTDAIISVEVAIEERNMKLEDGYEPILGYSSIL